MFDYAIDSNRRYRPTRAYSRVLGIELHCSRRSPSADHSEPLDTAGGAASYLPAFVPCFGNLFFCKSAQDDDWRTVAVVSSSMPMPSAATLRENIPDWNRPGTAPPVKVRWGTADLPVQDTPATQAPPKPESGQATRPDTAATGTALRCESAECRRHGCRIGHRIRSARTQGLRSAMPLRADPQPSPFPLPPRERSFNRL